MQNDTDKEEIFSRMQVDRGAALRQLKAFERQGDVDAGFMLGLLMWDSRSATMRQKAVTQFKHVAEQNHNYGCFYLGRAYWEGTGIRRNRKSAFRWLEAAGELGCVAAMMYLADITLDGGDEDSDPVRGVLWLRRAAQQSVALKLEAKSIGRYAGYSEYIADSEGFAALRAQEYLAVLYDEGKFGVQHDPATAAHWLRPVFHAGVNEHGRELLRLYREAGMQDDVIQVLDELSMLRDAQAMYELGTLLLQPGNSREQQQRGSRLQIESRRLCPVMPLPGPTVIRQRISNRIYNRFTRAIEFGTAREKMREARLLLKLEKPDLRGCVRILELEAMAEYRPAAAMRRKLKKELSEDTYRELATRRE